MTVTIDHINRLYRIRLYGNHEQLFHGLSEIFEVLKSNRCRFELILEVMLYCTVQDCMGWNASKDHSKLVQCKELSSAILAFMANRGDESFLAVVRNLPNTFELYFASSGKS